MGPIRGSARAARRRRWPRRRPGWYRRCRSGQRRVPGLLGRGAGKGDRAGGDGRILGLAPRRARLEGRTDAMARSGLERVASSQRPIQPVLTGVVGDTALPDVHGLEVAVVRVGKTHAVDDGQLLGVPQALEARHAGVESVAVAERSAVEGSTAKDPGRGIGGVLVGDDGVEPVVAAVQGDQDQLRTRSPWRPTGRGPSPNRDIPAAPPERRLRRRRAGRRLPGRGSAAIEDRRRCERSPVRAAGRWASAPSGSAPSALLLQLVTYSGETRANVTRVGGSRRHWRGPGRCRALQLGNGSSSARPRPGRPGAHRRRPRCRSGGPSGARTPAGEGRRASRASSCSADQPPTLGGSNRTWPIPARTPDDSAASPGDRRADPERPQRPTTYSVGCLTSPRNRLAGRECGCKKMAESSSPGCGRRRNSARGRRSRVGGVTG